LVLEGEKEVVHYIGEDRHKYLRVPLGQFDLKASFEHKNTCCSFAD
jgi:hypothetical protein